MKYRNKSKILIHSSETDWTDDILWSKIKILGVIKQYSSAYNNRPDYFLEAEDGNVVAEVKYIRNKSSTNFALNLMTNDQIERYLNDPGLNTKKMIILILIDKLKMDNLEIHSIETLIKTRIKEIESKAIKQGKSINLKIMLVNYKDIRRDQYEISFIYKKIISYI